MPQPPATTPLIPTGGLVRMDPTTGTLRARRCQVTVIAGPDRGKSCDLQGVIQVGSHPEVGLPLTDSTISRYHVELQARPEGVRVKDLGSTNGTYIAGTRIQEAVVEDEATLVLGMTRLRVTASEEDLGKPEARASFGEVHGQSAQMQSLFGILARVAPTETSVVLLGETGTGKEVLARALHQASLRHQQPFVVLDCAALVKGVVESELFGHVKGAFTGADGSRPGAFAEAHGGTLFLDELGELPLDLQPKLLRVLETGMVRPVGADTLRSVNVRVVAATHRSLEQEVAEGRFRQDLYFRLAVMPIHIPPLRERLEDIPLLVQHFVQRIGRPDYVFPRAMLEALAAHPWPGNVRELRNVVERAVLLFPQGQPQWQMVMQPAARKEAPKPSPLSPAQAERDQIMKALELCGGNQSLAAKRLGISRGTLISRIKDHAIPRPRKS